VLLQAGREVRTSPKEKQGVIAVHVHAEDVIVGGGYLMLCRLHAGDVGLRPNIVSVAKR
jgi:hypothetical protein